MSVYLTHGAKKNVGDYLIHSRALKLWEHVAPYATTSSIPRWNASQLPVDAQLLVLCGGPGFTPKMAEGVFPIIQSALDVGVPISGFALGWQGLPRKRPEGFSMTARSVATLHNITSSGAPLSVRDDVTQEIAQLFGVPAVKTGCSAWYSVPHMGLPPEPGTPDPRTIVYTTPALPQHAKESMQIMRMLKRRFPRAKMFATFHRGIGPDSFTTRRQSAPLIAQALAAKALGYEVLDVAYDLEKISFYQDIDLHVGYRVHAHLDFVSRRRPSLLISEDGRGFGQTVSLHGNKLVLWAGSSNIIGKVDRRLGFELRKGWPSLNRAVETIENTFPTMKSAIEAQAALRLPASRDVFNGGPLG